MLWLQKETGSSWSTKMANLPDNRVTPSEPRFSYVGVDCFGPLDVCWGRSTVKWYGVLFTCLSIWAIHIEVAHSLDTDSFIDALRRCIAWKGKTLLMRSDNGGNFVKAKRELCEAVCDWNQSKIHDFLLARNIKWIFLSSCPVISWGCLGVMHSFCAEGDESSHEGRAFRWPGFADSNLWSRSDYQRLIHNQSIRWPQWSWSPHAQPPVVIAIRTYLTPWLVQQRR